MIFIQHVIYVDAKTDDMLFSFRDHKTSESFIIFFFYEKTPQKTSILEWRLLFFCRT